MPETSAANYEERGITYANRDGGLRNSVSNPVMILFKYLTITESSSLLHEHWVTLF